MRTKITLATTLAVISLLAVTAVAVAAGTLTLTASATAVKYPHSVRLTVGFPTADPATATIMALPAGASEWTTVSTATDSSISSSRRSRRCTRRYSTEPRATP